MTRPRTPDRPLDERVVDSRRHPPRPLPDVPGRHDRACRRHAAARATSSVIPGAVADPRARRRGPRAARPPVAGRRSARRCSRSRPARSTSRRRRRSRIPDLAAPRELEEETGMRAASWRELAEFWTAPGLRVRADAPVPRHGSATGRRRRASTPDEDEHLAPRADAVARRASRPSSAARSRDGEDARRRCSGSTRAPHARASSATPVACSAGAGRVGRPALGAREPRQRLRGRAPCRAERDREAEVGPRLAPAPEPLQALAEREMARSATTDRSRAAPRTSRARGSCWPELKYARPSASRIERLAGLEPVRPLEDDRGLRVMSPLEEALAALQQLVRRLAVGGIRRRHAVLGHARSLHEIGAGRRYDDSP